MPFARRRLDLLLVPHDAEYRLAPSILAALAVRGLCTPEGAAAEAPGLPGFARLRVDLPPGRTLYGTQAGRHEVRCPRSGAEAAGAVAAMMPAWRANGPDEVQCPCGQIHSLAEMAFAPPAAPGRSALVVVDADAYLLEEPALGVLTDVIGPFRLIPRRVS